MPVTMGELEILVRDSGSESVLRALGRIDTVAAKLGAKPLTVSIAAPNAAVVTRTLTSLGAAGEQAGAQVARGMQQAAAATQATTRTLEQQQRIWEAEARRDRSLRSGPMLGPALPGLTTQIAAQASAAAKAATDQAAASAEKLSTTITRLIGNIVTMGKELDVTNRKAVQGFMASADATTAYALNLGATDQQLDQIGASLADVERRQALAMQTTTRATSMATAGVTMLGRQVTTTSGQLSSFSMRGLGAINAVGFGLSQLAATGTTSFRSVATGATSFLSFFGPGGAIASGVISTGLILTDFWSRQRREIEQTRKLVDDLVDAGKRRDAIGVLDEQEKAVRALIDANREARAAELDLSRRTMQLKEGTFVRPVNEERLNELAAERMKLEQSLTEILRRRGDEQAKEGKQAEDLERERQQRIAEQVSSLQTLTTLGKATSEDMRQSVLLERQLRAELKRTNEQDLERRATLLQQIATLSSLAIRPLSTPAVGATPSRERAGPLLPGERPTPGRGGSAERLELPIIPVVTPQAMKDARERMQAAFDAAELQSLQEDIGASLSSAIAGAITRGFAEGLARGGIKEGFRALGRDMLSGLGSVFAMVGEKALAGSLLLQKISAAIASWSPWVAIPTAIALIALGSAMSGRGSGGSAGASLTSVPSGARDTVTHIWLDPDRRLTSGPDRPSIAPTPRSPLPSDLPQREPMIVQNHFTIIGESDPRVQGQIARITQRAARAGYQIGNG